MIANANYNTMMIRPSLREQKRDLMQSLLSGEIGFNSEKNHE